MGTNVTGSQPFSSEVYLTQIFPDIFKSAFENAMTVHSQAGGLLMDVESDTEQNIYTFLSQSIGMQKWEGERKVRELSGSEFTVVNDDFELTYGIKRDALLDRSRIQGISDYITKMGEAAAEHKDRLSWEFLDLQGTTALCYDGTPLIGAAHPLKKGSDWSNIDTTGAGPKWFLMDTRTSSRAVLFQTREAYSLEVLSADVENSERGFMRREHLVGAFSRVAVAPAMPHRVFQSTATLDFAGFSDARAQMRRFRGDGDRPIMVQPNVLMVPPELETTALQLMQNERNSSGSSNILRGAAEVVVNPFLA